MGDVDDKLDRLAGRDKLSETLSDRDGGDMFRRDLEEARQLAADDPRFEALARELEASSLGERLQAVDRFFKKLDPEELAELELPPHLSQLRTIYLMSG